MKYGILFHVHKNWTQDKWFYIDIIYHKEEVLTRFEELVKEDKQPLMKNGPIFKWILGNIILDDQEEEEYFEDLIHDLQHHHNGDNDSDYLPDDYDEDDDSLGYCKSEYVSVEE